MVIISFDVFDTLLVREVAVPSDIFHRIGSELERQSDFHVRASEFCRMRQEAEMSARRAEPSGEVTFAEIYSVLKTKYAWSELQMLRAMDVELLTESETLSAVPCAIEMVEAARPDGKSIWFLSDMYLPSTFVEEILRREGFYIDGDRLVVSGECRFSKHKATMFNYIKDLVSPQEIGEWFHTGDNISSDYNVPISHGITATHWNRATLSFREKAVRGAAPYESYWKGQLAGAMRKARLTQEAVVRTGHPSLRECATNVAGPLIFAFVWWCLKESMAAGIKRLYFVSRDGQILARVAKELSDAWSLDVDIRYLYGSRKAWHLPGLADVNAPEVRAWLWKGAGGISVSKIFERLELNPDDFEADLESAGFTRKTWNHFLDQSQRERLTRLLMDPGIHDLVLDNAFQKRQFLQRYLEAQDFFDGTSSCLVDVGWHGNMQVSLAAALHQMGKAATLTGFYFGLFHQHQQRGEQNLRSFFNEVTGHVFPNDAAPMIELFLAADHGTVIGYQEQQGVVVPMFRTEKNESALEWGLLDFQSAVVSGADYLSGAFPMESDDFLNVAQATIGNFMEYFRKPRREEAELWRRFHFYTDQEESTLLSLLPDLTCREMALAAWLPSRRPEGWWMEGALSLGSCPMLSLYLALKRIRKAILHLMICMS